MGRIISVATLSACVALLSSCGEPQVHAAAPEAGLRADSAIASTAPGEIETSVFTTKPVCADGIPTPTRVTKRFYSAAPGADVRAYYTSITQNGRWFHRADTSDEAFLTLNYSRQVDDVYWQLHLGLPRYADGFYQVQVEAFDDGAVCR